MQKVQKLIRMFLIHQKTNDKKFLLFNGRSWNSVRRVFYISGFQQGVEHKILKPLIL
jgi:hypothetical protein